VWHVDQWQVMLDSEISQWREEQEQLDSAAEEAEGTAEPAPVQEHC